MSVTRLRPVSAEELPALYRLNRQMAVEEGQGELFSARYAEYAEAFCAPCALLKAWWVLFDQEETPQSFLIAQEKFATYLERKVLYVEDCYLSRHRTDPKAAAVMLRSLDDLSQKEGYARIEFRRLERYGIDADALRQGGYAPVEKWRIWRKGR